MKHFIAVLLSLGLLVPLCGALSANAAPYSATITVSDHHRYQHRHDRQMPPRDRDFRGPHHRFRAPPPPPPHHFKRHHQPRYDHHHYRPHHHHRY